MQARQANGEGAYKRYVTEAERGVESLIFAKHLIRLSVRYTSLSRHLLPQEKASCGDIAKYFVGRFAVTKCEQDKQS